MPEDAVQFVRGVLPSTVTVGSTYTIPPHSEPHVVLLIVDEGSCVVVHLAPLGHRSALLGHLSTTVKKGMKWFASSASPVKLTDKERVRADAARERFAQGAGERERHLVVANAARRRPAAAGGGAMPEDAVQFVRGVLPSTVTVGSTYTLPPHNEPHVVLLIVDKGSCVDVHLAPLGSGPSGSAATVKKGMEWFASSASPVKLTDEERVRADAARERFAQREQRLEESRKQAERASREQAERERHAASQRQQEAQRARWHAEAHRKPWDNSFCWPWPNAGIAALVITILLLGFGFPVYESYKSQLSSYEICLSTSGDEICVVEISPLTTYRRDTELSFMREGSVGATIVGGLFA